MKKIIIYSIIFVFGIIGFSCDDDFLNTKPLDKFSEEDVWNDVNMVQGFIFETYNSVIPTLVKNPKDDGRGSTMDNWTDNIATRSNDVVAKDQMDKYFDAGWDAFGTIRKCNLIIENVAASTGILEGSKEGLIAQGKMLRALIYYRQARLFGKYTVVDKVLTQEDEMKLPRTSTIKETYDFILKDLDDAIEGLPVVVPAGQLSKGAALAMKAEIALHGAAYIESGKEEYYAVVKKASEDLFALGIYELDNSYLGLCNDFEHAYGSKEVILGYFKHADNNRTKNTPQQIIVPNCSENKNHPWVSPKLVESIEGWAGIWPSNSLVDDYLVVDTDGEAKKWDETSYYSDFVANGGYVSNAIYKNRDLRFYASVAQDSSKYFNNIITIRRGGNMHWESNASGNWSMTRSGYYFRKGVYENVKLWANNNQAYHFHIMRLGRAYLNYAEVMLRLDNPAIAIEYINKTRNTHGALPALSVGLSMEDAWKYYRIERRVELFYENDRYWSLIRWGKEAGDIIIPELNSGQTAIEIAEDGMSFQIIPLANNKSENERVFSTKRYLFPVPENERLLNENLDQNPEW